MCRYVDVALLGSDISPGSLCQNARVNIRMGNQENIGGEGLDR